MQVLFYVEPLVERENPTWKAWWIEHFVKKISSALLAEGIAEEDLACLVPTALGAAARKVLPGSRVVSIDQTELVPRFGGSALEVASAWYKRIASDQALFDMATLVKERLGDFVPACCITFSPAPFLNAAWPDARVLHMECGFLSRPPYPETVYFDPYGMFSDSALARFSSELRERVPGGGERALLSNLRERFCKFGHEQSNPFADLMPDVLIGFESAVLLALQFSNFYAYNANARFADQYDLLVHTLQSVPRNVAVVVCEHPEHPVLKPEVTAYLSRLYPNFVWHPLFRQVYGASHYLMPFVQGVVTVSSSVGLQALLWKKKLVVLGGGHLAPISDTCEVSDLIPFLGGTWSEEKDRILCWLLSSFHLPFEALLTSGRLSQYFMALTTGDIGTVEEACASVGLDADKLLEFYDSAWSKRPMSPYGTVKAMDGNSFFAALYVATEGRSYDERSCLRQFVSQLNGEEVCLNFSLDRDNTNPISVRFDPTNRSGFLQMRELALLDVRGAILWKWGGGNRGIRASRGVGVFDNADGALLLCYDDDPQIELDIDFSLYARAPRPLLVRARFASAGLTEVGKQLSELDVQIANLSRSVMERDVQIASLGKVTAERDLHLEQLNKTVEERDVMIEKLNEYKSMTIELDKRCSTELEALNKQISRISGDLLNERTLHQQEIAHIRKSTSWRLTAPIRLIGINIRRAILVPKIFILAYKKSGGILSLLQKAIRVYKNEGFNGARKIAKLLLHPVVQELTNEGGRVGVDLINNYEIPRVSFDLTTDRYYEYKENSDIDPVVKLIAFYLPQFHPFSENDEWWGKGFTEWTNVGKAKPNYVGHYQPHCPIHFGYYDLRIPSVMEEQAKLAREYGVYGFNYYFYWFGGKVLMEYPLEMMLANKNVDIKFCLTWANENWSRRWDGQENDILIAQNHSDDDSIAFIRYIVKYFKDDRYIKIDGKPMLTIYRANIIPDIERTAMLWREEVVRYGFPGIYLVAAQSFGIRSPAPFGFDSAMEFPPHTIASSDITSAMDLTNNNYTGHIYSYDEVVANAVTKEEPSYKLFRTAMLSWDNTARKQNASHIFSGFSLLRYKQWLSNLVHKCAINDKYSSQEKFVFINAWNEWAEGTHLEPDQKFGYGYLQTTYDVISEYDKSNASLLKPKENSNHAKCAVIIHAHYVDVLPEIGKFLIGSFGEMPYDLFITLTTSKSINQVKSIFPHANISLVENRGRDVLPFISVMREISNNGYHAVCKIHTKKSLYRDDGDQIRCDLYESLLKNSARVHEIVSRFESNEMLGMVVPKKYLLSHSDHNMTFDYQRVDQLSKHLNISFNYDSFPAGSMFWFRPSALVTIINLNDSLFEVESGLADGTTAHAVERLFCIIAKSNNFEVATC